eukprot:CAMPEP_0205852950 /NCGR_PEP_ID=MMETSP1083-20121108/1286_1 /ASSEMBLY_ACC=CAM_ASM_000430 /TAXON_ID=97485 /ORGANISM="Prymnesium parvum, Strain Texoma1" /LENGTH=184 /DNA_ID=CAMNT_0053214175 /DNA_START=581 /DNA_END=1136 /DNA_ORIENTATION=-
MDSEESRGSDDKEFVVLGSMDDELPALSLSRASSSRRAPCAEGARCLEDCCGGHVGSMSAWHDSSPKLTLHAPSADCDPLLLLSAQQPERVVPPIARLLAPSSRFAPEGLLVTAVPPALFDEALSDTREAASESSIPMLQCVCQGKAEMRPPVRRATAVAAEHVPSRKQAVDLQTRATLSKGAR